MGALLLPRAPYLPREFRIGNQGQAKQDGRIPQGPTHAGCHNELAQDRLRPEVAKLGRSLCNFDDQKRRCTIHFTAAS